MLLEDWLKETSVRRIELARRTGIDPSIIYRCLSGERKFSPDQAVKIEKATNGSVSRSEVIWAEDFKFKKEKHIQMTMFSIIEDS